MAKKYIEQQDLLLLLNSDLLGYACAINLEDDSGSETAKAKYEELKRVINLIENQKSIEVKCPKDIEPIFVDKSSIINVVRCKDCIHCRKSYDPNIKISRQVCGYVGYNPVQSSEVTDYDFCSHGEKRMDGDNNG